MGNKLDVSGVAAKLNHWKANEYRHHDPRNAAPLENASSDPTQTRQVNQVKMHRFTSEGHPAHNEIDNGYYSSPSSGGEYSNSDDDEPDLAAAMQDSGLLSPPAAGCAAGDDDTAEYEMDKMKLV